MSITCSIYGLGLQVNTAIAGLATLPKPERIDVVMTLGELPPGIDQIPESSVQSQYVSPQVDDDGRPEIVISTLLDSGFHRIAYSDGMNVVVDAHGTRVWVDGPHSVDYMATSLLGPILGLVLRLRGIACLHGSAVAVGGQAIALVGPSESGKSSTAAAFARLGHAVLTDDKLAVLRRGDHYEVQPAYPSVRLWPESVASLFGSADALPVIAADSDKRFLDLTQTGFRFQSTPLPLAAIYFLGERRVMTDIAQIGPVTPRAGLMTLVSDLHATSVLDRSQRSAEFEFLGQLVENVPMRQLTPNADIALIDRLCQAILDDFDQLIAVPSH
jgi:hypothetical protein